MRLLCLAGVVVLASACFQAPEEGPADGGAGGGAGGGATGGGVGGGAMGGGIGGGVGVGGGIGGGPTGGGVGGGPTGGGTGTLLFGAMRHDCAPNDGPALFFMLTDSPVGCEALNASEGYQVSLWTGAPQLRSYSLGADFAHEGAACLCGVVGDRATSGSVTIEEVTDAGVRGRVDATFMSGTERHDVFEVVVCPGVPLCG